MPTSGDLVSTSGRRAVRVAQHVDDGVLHLQRRVTRVRERGRVAHAAVDGERALVGQPVAPRDGAGAGVQRRRVGRLELRELHQHAHRDARAQADAHAHRQRPLEPDAAAIALRARDAHGRDLTAQRALGAARAGDEEAEFCGQGVPNLLHERRRARASVRTPHPHPVPASRGEGTRSGQWAAVRSAASRRAWAQPRRTTSASWAPSISPRPRRQLLVGGDQLASRRPRGRRRRRSSPGRPAPARGRARRRAPAVSSACASCATCRKPGPTAITPDVILALVPEHARLQRRHQRHVPGQDAELAELAGRGHLVDVGVDEGAPRCGDGQSHRVSRGRLTPLPSSACRTRRARRRGRPACRRAARGCRRTCRRRSP